ncbi:MAG: hypothetical protein GY906_14465 [bacterium]|nr:hypothetical protein [bacterium]
MIDRRKWRARVIHILLVVVCAGVLGSCSAQRWVSPRKHWYPSIAKFFKYLEDPANASDTVEFEAFTDLFTDEARDDLLVMFGGPEAFRHAVSEQGSVELPWPGHFRRFALGLGRYLAAVQYDKEGRVATATTMVSREDGDFRIDQARLYRFRFDYDGSKWKISGFKFVRRDPTLANVQPGYVYTVAGFVVFNALALLPFLLPFLFIIIKPKVLVSWTFGCYKAVFAVFIAVLEMILGFRKALLRRVWAPFFTLVLCPLVFLGLLRGFTSIAPRIFNSHVGFLLVLLLVASFMSLAILKEVFDFYHAKAAGVAVRDMQRDPRAVILGRRQPHFRFDAETYKRVTVSLVLMVMAFGVIGFLPYRNKFRVSVTSETQLVFSVEGRVETAAATTVSRLPSVQQQYVLAEVGAGESFPMIEEVNSEEGVFYRVAFNRRALGYLPAEAVERIDQTLEFRLEGDYINYLEQLGYVLNVSDPASEVDPEARILANAFLDEATRGIRKADLRSLTRSINDLNRAIEFDPVYGDLYLHRALALAGVGRFLRDDAVCNAFGLAGDAVANPDKVNVLFYRAAQNVDMAERLGTDAGATQAVRTLIGMYRGKRLEAMAVTEGQHPLVLLSQIYEAAEPAAAIEAAEALLRVEPDNARVLNDRGILLAAQNRSVAQTAFDQVTRVSRGLIEGRTNLATCKLAGDRVQGLAELNEIIASESDFTHRARFVRNLFWVNAIAIVVFPLTAALAIVGVFRLARMGIMTKVAHRSAIGAAIRLAFLLVVLLILSFQSVAWTLPSYGEVGPLLPWMLTLIGQ